MAKRRILKKKVNYITSVLFMQGMVCRNESTGENVEKADQILADVLDVQNEFISRLSHVEPGNVKGFFKKFHEDLVTRIGSITQAIEKLQ